ncbi:MAG: OmpA family protein [Alphaproteobacteria bacterium]|jgi:outer membrane protein OmpA-like peptidoglycan-associated protein|nr:OmpA family protein [Alphaproteobacteria bacterium]
MSRRLPGRPAAALLLAAALAAGCTAAPEIDELRRTAPPSGAFAAALFDGYLALAADEQAEGDWDDAAVFRDRAARLAAGETVLPEAPETRMLATADRATLAAARDELVRALRRGGRVFAPDAAARAQIAYDCWSQELEENRQPGDIATCRRRFEQALAEVLAAGTGSVFTLLDDGAAGGAPAGAITLTNPAGSIALDEPGTGTLVAAPDAAPGAAARLDAEAIDTLYGDALAAEPERPDRFVLYFETGTTDLTPESAALVDEVLAAVARRTAPRIDVIGHADRVGPAALNAALSLERAELVRTRLAEAGVPGTEIDTDSYGEADPVVPTPDEVAEPLNRRVEIVVR